jgi:hypothetical protein
VPEGAPPPESPLTVARSPNELPELPELPELTELTELNEIPEKPSEGFPTPRTHFRKLEAGPPLKKFLVLSVCVITHVF